MRDHEGSPGALIGHPAARDHGLDRLRGLAIVLMILDHTLAVLMACWSWEEWMRWTRQTLTRFSMPLFMIVSGVLLARKGHPSWRRVPQIVVTALVLNLLLFSYNVGLAAPEILAVWVLVLPLYPLIIRFPIEFAVLGILQTINVPVHWDGYQPGYIVAFLAMGVLLQRQPKSLITRVSTGLPSFLEAPGRRPLTWYFVHHLVVVCLGLQLLGEL